jgi:hypothetical protein
MGPASDTRSCRSATRHAPAADHRGGSRLKTATRDAVPLENRRGGFTGHCARPVLLLGE